METNMSKKHAGSISRV